MAEVNCPICESHGVRNTFADPDGNSEARLLECPVCGPFVTDDRRSLEHFIQSNVANDRLIGRIQGWIRDRSEHRSTPPFLETANLERLKEIIPDPSIAEREMSILRALGRRSGRCGAEIHFVPENQFPVAWTKHPEEARYFLDSLIASGFVEGIGLENNYVVTPSGWKELEESNEDILNSDQGFVAMWFDEDMLETVYPRIKAAIEACGYKPYLVAKDLDTEMIDNRIIANIKRSRFLIADVTGQRNGVYFEAGLAKGIGIPVIWSVRKDELKNVHFDTRQFPYIDWADPAELQIALENWIEAVIGKKQ